MKRALALLAVLLSLAAAAAIKLHPLDRDGYVGSQSCAGCHGAIFAAWKDSQHTRMMRPVDTPGAVVADFAHDDARLFERSAAVWAIGGKWEQQFMGHDASGETLLPGVWLGARGAWEFKGWDGWDVPVPRRRCHGCHTVGLDVASGHFVEPNIGCESCHGPGAWHAKTLGFGRIHSSGDAQVCGQCHVRGRSVSNETFFPDGYRPGDVLADYMVEGLPQEGHPDDHWWPDGFERDRHQEYSTWRQGGHARSLAALREGYDGRYGKVESDCLRCHAGDYILADGAKPSAQSAALGITCAVCHNAHGALDQPRMTCAECHGTGAFYHEPARNTSHVACPSSAEVGCVGCHMPRVVRIGGAFTLHSHRPGVARPDAAAPPEMPNSCQNGGCHADRTLSWALEAYARHYPGERAELKR